MQVVWDTEGTAPPEPDEDLQFARARIACAKQAMADLLNGHLAQAWPAARSIGMLEPVLASGVRDVRENILLSDGGVKRETYADGRSLIVKYDWAIVEDCAALRGVVVHIGVQEFPGDDHVQLASFEKQRGALARELEGVVAVYVEDNGGGPYITALVCDLVVGRGVRLRSAAEYEHLLQRKCLVHSASVLRGYRCFLPNILRQIDRARLAAQRDITDSGFAMELHARRKPEDYDRVMGQIETRSRDELRRFLEHVQRELWRGLARALQAVESDVREASEALLECKEPPSGDKVHRKRNGAELDRGMELMQVRSEFLEHLLETSKRIISAPDKGITTEIADATQDFWRGRLIELIRGILEGTTLARDGGLEAAWPRINDEDFYAPMPSDATEQIFASTLGNVPRKALEETPEFEVPAPFAFTHLRAQIMLPLRRFQQRYSGVLALLMLGGLGFTSLVRDSIKDNGWLLVVLCVVLGLGTWYLLKRIRQEEIFKARIAARASIINAYSRAQAEFAAEWTRAFATNSTNELEDLLRRVRTDIESPWARVVATWENEGAMIERRRRAIEGSARFLEQLPRQVAETERQLGKLSDELTRALMQPSARRN